MRVWPVQSGSAIIPDHWPDGREEGHWMATKAPAAGIHGHDETIDRYKHFVTTSFVASVEPVVVERAEGATIWDADGTEYIDCFAGIAVNNAGHRHPRVIEAVKEQLDKVVHAATYVYHVPVVADAAE